MANLTPQKKYVPHNISPTTKKCLICIKCTNIIFFMYVNSLFLWINKHKYITCYLSCETPLTQQLNITHLKLYSISTNPKDTRGNQSNKIMTWWASGAVSSVDNYINWSYLFFTTSKKTCFWNLGWSGL